jgi:hypothetical protein
MAEPRSRAPQTPKILSEEDSEWLAERLLEHHDLLEFLRAH